MSELEVFCFKNDKFRLCCTRVQREEKGTVEMGMVEREEGGRVGEEIEERWRGGRVKRMEERVYTYVCSAVP